MIADDPDYFAAWRLHANVEFTLWPGQLRPGAEAAARKQLAAQAGARKLTKQQETQQPSQRRWGRGGACFPRYVYAFVEGPERRGTVDRFTKNSCRGGERGGTTGRKHPKASGGG